MDKNKIHTILHQRNVNANFIFLIQFIDNEIISVRFLTYGVILDRRHLVNKQICT